MFKNFFSKSSQPQQSIEESVPETKEKDFLDEPITISSMIKDSNKNEPSSLLAVTDDDIEYLTIEDNPFMKPQSRPIGSFGPLPMRNTSDRLQYGTGSMYLLGLTSGGTYGFIRGLRKATGNSFKLRLNSVLNTVTRFGPWAANSLGIMTLGWTSIDYAIVSFRGGKSDYWNHISAAFVSGFIFKSTAGLRPATLQGALAASVVSAYGLITKYQEGSLKMPFDFNFTQNSNAE